MYVYKNPDVDIIIVTSLSETEYTPRAALELFKPFLERYYSGKYKLQGRSWGIQLSNVDLDFCPNFYRNKNREITLDVSNEGIKGIELFSENPTLDEMYNGKLIFASMNKNCIVIPSISSFQTLLNLFHIFCKYDDANVNKDSNNRFIKEK